MKFKTKEERENFIIDNLGLVEYAIHKKLVYNDYTDYDLSTEDVRQIGRVGLIKAIDNFDESLGYAFSSFAMKYIIGDIFNASKYVKNGIRYGSRTLLKKQKIDKYLQIMSIEEVSKELNLDIDEVKQLKNLNLNTLKLNTPVKNQDEENLEMMDCIENLKQYVDYDEKMRIEYMLSVLNEKEKGIVIDYIFNDYNQTELGEKYGVCQQRAGKILKKALGKMKDNALQVA